MVKNNGTAELVYGTELGNKGKVEKVLLGRCYKEENILGMGVIKLFTVL